MVDKEIICDGPYEMIEAAHQMIYESLGKLKYVNLKYKIKDAVESGWLYNVDFEVQDNKCLIKFLNADAEAIVLPVDEIDYFKLRPYYIAACVGFKNIIFYSHESKGEAQ